jgi:hypothetical protein
LDLYHVVHEDDMELKQQIEDWRKQTGLSTLQLGDKTEIEYAMNVQGSDLTTLSPVQMDEVMSVLANYLLYLAHEMGVLFARVKYLEAAGPKRLLYGERAKLNIVKPVHDAIKVKIDLLKKIYDRKVRDATGNRG